MFSLTSTIISLQFLVKTPAYATTCTAKPVFVDPTPSHGTVYYLEPASSVGIPMYAANKEDNNTE